MAGNIQKLGEQRYRLRIFEGRDANGKQKFYTEVYHGTKKEAEAKLRDLLFKQQHQQPLVKKSDRKFLNDVFDDWLKKQVQVKPRTRALYEMYLREYVRPYLGTARIDQVNAEAVQGVVGKLLERELSSSVVRYAIMVLSAVLRDAVAQGKIPRNPIDIRRGTATIKLPKLERKQPGALDVQQARTFVDACRASRWGALFIVAIVSGLRPGELQGVMREDMDWENSVLHVIRAIEWDTPTTWRIGKPKTDTGTRSVLLPPDVVQILREHLAAQDAERERLGEHYEDHGFMFAGESGRPFNRKNVIRRHLRPLLKKAGLPDDLRMYDLRHSSATVDMMLGTPPKVVAEKLGHTNPGFTLRTYSHVKPIMQVEAVKKLTTALFSEDDPHC